MRLFKKLRKAFINHHDLKKYFLYALGEIFLVVIGISIALQVNNWNNHRLNSNAEQKYYQNTHDQIEDDKDLILELVDFNNGYLAQYSYAFEIIELNDRNKMDTLGVILRNLTQYSDFDRQGNIYETMINSGEIKLLHNYEIVNHIRKLEEEYLYVNRMENIHYDAMMNYVVPALNPNLKFSNAEIKTPNAFFTYEFQNLLSSIIQVMKEKDEVYHEALDRINKITVLIEKELEVI